MKIVVYSGLPYNHITRQIHFRSICRTLQMAQQQFAYNVPTSVNNCEEKSSLVHQQLPFLLFFPIQLIQEMFLVY